MVVDITVKSARVVNESTYVAMCKPLRGGDISRLTPKLIAQTLRAIAEYKRTRG